MSIETQPDHRQRPAVEVVRKDIKNLHLGVYPPNGRVRVAAPLRVSDDAVRLAVIGKLGWIKRQQASFKRRTAQSEREMVSGESHYFLGRRYRLRVIHRCRSNAGLSLRNRVVYRTPRATRTTAAQREKVLQRWYRRQLKS